MGDHLKRLNAPGSWQIPKKIRKFILKTSPGPHNANAIPLAVWLRDKMGFARNLKEVKQILNDRVVLVNGRVATDPKLGIGIFDIIAIPKIGKYYRILRDKQGRHKTIEIDSESAKTRLCRINNKTTIKGGGVQLNLRDGTNVIADNSYKSKDSIVISLEPESRLKILDHFPYAVGNMAMIIGGKHSGKIARVVSIETVLSSVSNRVILEDEQGERFDPIESYIIMVGRDTPALSHWGIEE